MPNEKKRFKSLKYFIIGGLLALCLIGVLFLPLFDKRIAITQKNVKETLTNPLGAYTYYGDIGSIIETYEYDAQEGIGGNPYDVLRLGTGNYFVIASTGDTGTEGDGYLRTVYCTDAGDITNSLIDYWEFDSGDGILAGIFPISGNVYAIVYRGTTYGRIITTTIHSSDGTIDGDTIDSINFNETFAIYPNFPTMVHMYGNIYAVTYQDSVGYDHQLVTFSITDAGVITDTIIDNVEVDANPTANRVVHSCLVDSNTIAMVCTGEGDDGYLYTYNISSSGDITNTKADSCEFDTNKCLYPFIYKISTDVYAITYGDTTNDGFTKTISIADTGMIYTDWTSSTGWIDSLEWKDADTLTYMTMFTVVDANNKQNKIGTYGVVGKGGLNAIIATMNITTAGAITDTVSDVVNSVANIYWISFVYVNTSVYLCVYTASDNDGFVNSITICSYDHPPIITPRTPLDGATGVYPFTEENVSCFVYTYDLYGDTLTLEFWTNASGSWIKYTGLGYGAVANSTRGYQFPYMNQPNTKYWWSANISDGTYWTNTTYNFTTGTLSYWDFKSPDTAEATSNWDDVGQSKDNNLLTMSRSKDSTNYIYLNVSSSIYCDGGRIIACYLPSASAETSPSIDFDLYYDGTYNDVYDGAIDPLIWVDMINSAGNKTVTGCRIHTNATSVINCVELWEFDFRNNTPPAVTWHLVDNSINGVWSNTTIFRLVDNSINGVWNNLTIWRLIDDSINGIWTNISQFYLVDNSINGIWSNTTQFQLVDNSINGIWSNNTFFRLVDNNINGVWTNTTNWVLVDDNINGIWTNISYVPDWKLVDNSINGIWTNNTFFRLIDNTINGIWSNNTFWRLIDNNINGIWTNNTIWRLIDNNINGVWSNTTIFRLVDNTINGVWSNATIPIWYLVDDSINGIWKNTTNWMLVDNTINGVWVNNQIWKLVDNSINGIWTNNTRWNLVDNTINGVWVNNTYWKLVDNSINGVWKNITSWRLMDNSINGVWSNTTTFRLVDNTINGVWTNATIPVWYLVDDSINGVWSNNTIWKLIDNTINGVWKNTTQFYLVDNTINGVWTNKTFFHLIDNNINGVWTNNTYWKLIDNTINGVWSNTSKWYLIDNTINGVWTNATIPIWYLMDNTINGVWTNNTNWKLVDNNINGIWTNTTRFYLIDNSINGIWKNTTTYKLMDNTINGVWNNQTLWRLIDNTINGIWSNVTIPEWTLIDNTINGVWTNTTPWNLIDDTINGVWINDTETWQLMDNNINGVWTNMTIVYINITNIYPSNSSYNIPLQPNLYLTANSTIGNTLNLSFYYGTSLNNTPNLLGTYNNETNGTYSILNYNASNRFTNYYWRIMVDDGTYFVNQSYCFKTEGYQIASTSNNISILGILGIFGILSFIFALIGLRKRRNY